MSKPKNIYIMTDIGVKRKIGTFENGKFVSVRKSSKHLYHTLNAWGIDYEALKGLHKDKGLHTIVIHDMDTKIRYEVDAETFLEKGIVLHFKPHRVQSFLPLEYWRRL